MNTPRHIRRWLDVSGAGRERLAHESRLGAFSSASTRCSFFACIRRITSLYVDTSGRFEQRRERSPLRRSTPRERTSGPLRGAYLIAAACCTPTARGRWSQARQGDLHPGYSTLEFADSAPSRARPVTPTGRCDGRRDAQGSHGPWS